MNWPLIMENETKNNKWIWQLNEMKGYESLEERYHTNFQFKLLRLTNLSGRRRVGDLGKEETLSCLHSPNWL